LISLGGEGSRTKLDGEKKKDEGEVDQMERFLNLVDWGDVPKPAEWEGAVAETNGAFEDAQEGEGEVEDINALAEKLGAVDVSKTA
jgi:hypothetical protein